MPVDPRYLDSTVDGQDHVDQITKYRTMAGSLWVDSAAQWLLFETMFNNVGLSKDLFVAFDWDNYPAARTMYGKFTDYDMTHDFVKQASLSFKESR